MRDILTYDTMIKKHSNSFIICIVACRDAETNKPKSYKVLQTAKTTEDLKKALDYYDAEGFENVIAINNFDEEAGKAPEFPPEIAARLFRNLYAR